MLLFVFSMKVDYLTNIGITYRFVKIISAADFLVFWSC